MLYLARQKRIRNILSAISPPSIKSFWLLWCCMNKIRQHFSISLVLLSVHNNSSDFDIVLRRQFVFLMCFFSFIVVLHLVRSPLKFLNQTKKKQTLIIFPVHIADKSVSFEKSVSFSDDIQGLPKSHSPQNHGKSMSLRITSVWFKLSLNSTHTHTQTPYTPVDTSFFSRFLFCLVFTRKYLCSNRLKLPKSS